MIASPYSHLLLAGALLGAAFAWPLPASAGVAGQALSSPAGAAEALFGSGPLDPNTLDKYRGGTEIEISNENKLHATATVDGNYAHDLTTGGNWVSEGSFAGASGLLMSIQNTGNNVLIQNSTIVNVDVH